MNFTALPGLTEIKSKLINAVRDNHIAHAQLFAGKPGSLNLPLALAYANYLHCQNKDDSDACGTCPACSKSAKYIHPDTHFVFPLGNIKGDRDEDRFKSEMLKTWRKFLLEQPFGDLNDWISFYGGEDKQALISREESREIIKTLSLKPFESPFKIMIIWQPELMHSSAANGILKILEEPPVNTFFILVTNGIERLLPTVLSRTQIVQVPLLADVDIEAQLQQSELSQLRLSEILSLADGNLNTALKLVDSEQDQYQEKFSSWMRMCFKKEYGKLVAMTDEFYELDKLDQQNFFAYSLGMIRKTALHFSGASAISRIKESEVKFIHDFSKVVNLQRSEKINELISDAAYHLERNGSAKMIFLDLSLELSQVFNR